MTAAEELTKVIDKVKKLLALSTSSNVNESAAAMELAQKLISRFGIEQQMLQTDKSTVEDIIDTGSAGEKPYVQFNQRSIKWKTILAMVIARHNHCAVTLHWNKNGNKLTGSKLNIVGTRSDIEVSRFLFDYISNEIDRLCWSHPDRSGGGKTWSNSYKLGAVTTITSRFDESRKKAVEEIKKENANNSTALIRIDKALMVIGEREKMVKQYVDHKTAGSKSREWHTTKIHNGAFLEGMNDAKNISLGNNKEIE